MLFEQRVPIRPEPVRKGRVNVVGSPAVGQQRDRESHSTPARDMDELARAPESVTTQSVITTT
jgi:hypothetical protein